MSSDPERVAHNGVDGLSSGRIDCKGGGIIICPVARLVLGLRIKIVGHRLECLPSPVAKLEWNPIRIGSGLSGNRSVIATAR